MDDRESITDAQSPRSGLSRRIRHLSERPILLTAIIWFSLLVHVVVLTVSETWLIGWNWAHEPLHACIEMVGACMALGVAGMLLVLGQGGKGTSFDPWIAGALVGMGALDGVHALANPGKLFVWFHSLSVVGGGLLFCCVWLPERWMRSVRPFWHWAVALTALFIVLLSLVFREHVPPMIHDGRFTPLANLLNLGGGILLLLASVRLLVTFRSRSNPDDLIFCLHCCLFGAAALMFQRSAPWDFTWWGWHLLRLMAYWVAFWVIVQAQLDVDRHLRSLTSRLREANRALRRRTAETTEANETLQRTNVELERSNRELSQFAYVASHDLQEPLRMVASYVQLLARRYRGRLDPEADEFIQYAVDGAARMKELIADLLEYSRVGSSRSPLVPVDCEDVMARVKENLALRIAEAGAVVSHGPLPTVDADPTLLVQLFQNLVSNAIKFRGERRPEVHIAASRLADGQWEFWVADNGIGLDSQYADKIFTIFQRLHDRDDYPGTGIGLAICRRIIERHEGRIWVESEPGQGATFRFTIGGARRREDRPGPGKAGS